MPSHERYKSNKLKLSPQIQTGQVRKSSPPRKTAQGKSGRKTTFTPPPGLPGRRHAYEARPRFRFLSPIPGVRSRGVGRQNFPGWVIAHACGLKRHMNSYRKPRGRFYPNASPQTNKSLLGHPVARSAPLAKPSILTSGNN